MKTLAIRLEDELHSRLGMLSRLGGTSVTDTIRTAIEKHLDALARDPEIAVKAESLATAIEEEAANQRQALAALIGSPQVAPTKTARGRGAAGKPA